MTNVSVHLAFREVTTGFGSALLKKTQRYRVRERKWQTRETLARSVYPWNTPLYTNGKEINGTKRRNIEARIHLLMLY